VERRSDWSWEEGAVDHGDYHLVLRHDLLGEAEVALVGPPHGNVFPVEFLPPAADEADWAVVLADVQRELTTYLTEVGGPDPWAYAHYHTGTFSNFYGDVHWSAVGAAERWLRDLSEDERVLLPLVNRAWELYARSLEAPETATVQPSMPILYFGDFPAYGVSPIRIVTVGLNPSLQEFPVADPWSRFPAAAHLEGETVPTSNEPGPGAYLAALNGYFTTDPYRWFNRSFEPLLRGLDASYYPGARSTALHTDIASPVATSPTWGKLGGRRAQHEGGAELWRDLVEVLAPDIIILSVAREHLRAVTSQRLEEWRELMRIERDRPFVVSETRIVLRSRPAMVVHGRSTNVPFGSVSYPDRERIGAAIHARLGALRAGEAET